jgi:molybdopterin adenylyltransferase
MVDANCLICVNPGCDLYIGNRVNIFMLSGLKQIQETLNIGIITASDRAYAGIYEDKSGMEIQKYIHDNVNIEKTDYKIFYKLANDDREKIKNAILELCDNLCCNLIFTTGGTGPDKRDVTDLVTGEICEKLLPGFGEIMRMKNFEYVPTSILSGQTAGIRYIKEDKGCLIVNLPGKPEAINDCLQIIFKSIPKCLNIIHANDLVLN